jgi:hypothetical protein
MGTWLGLGVMLFMCYNTVPVDGQTGAKEFEEPGENLLSVPCSPIGCASRAELIGRINEANKKRHHESGGGACSDFSELNTAATNLTWPWPLTKPSLSSHEQGVLNRFFNQMAVLSSEDGDGARAQQHLRHASAVMPNDPVSHKNLCIHLQHMQPLEAIQECKKALAVAQTFEPDTLILMVQIMMQNFEYREAEKVLLPFIRMPDKHLLAEGFALALENFEERLQIARLHNFYQPFDEGTGHVPKANSEELDFMQKIHALKHDAAAGDHYYRAFVGPSSLYGTNGAIQFQLLLAAGLSHRQTVLEVGCGSLRLGKMLIVFLDSGHYSCIEPNSWLFQAALRFEMGVEIQKVKSPHFFPVRDFRIPAHQQPVVPYDFMIAYSVFSHTNRPLLRKALANLKKVMGNSTVLLATFAIPDHDVVASTETKEQWIYPDLVLYTSQDVVDIAKEHGLVANNLGFKWLKQTWFAIGRNREGLETQIQKIRKVVIT